METNLAVLIDFENIAAGTQKEGLGPFDVEALMGRIKDKGRILIARSYADWGRFARFKKALLCANVTMMELTSHGMQDKNRADIAMVVDTLELAFTKDYIQTFVVVSGDSDFTPLVLKLRELNKRVIGCGTRASTSRLLIQACDEFFFYDSLVANKTEGSRARTNRRPRSGEPIRDRGAAFDALVDALQALQRENPDPPLASVLKGFMLRKSPDFSESELGYSSFARFLEGAQQGGYVSIIRDRKSGGYRVESTDSIPPEGATVPAPQRPQGAWFDPLLPESATEVVRCLATDGLNPLSAQTRRAILEAFKTVYEQREEKKRRINLRFIQEDVRRILRKSHADLPTRAVRDVFNAILRSGLLRHRDGNPIRSSSAPFTLDKSMDELSQAMISTYLGALVENDAEIADSDMLSHLFFGDGDQISYISSTLEWMSQADDADNSLEELDLELDLDDLLVVDSTDEHEFTSSPANPEFTESDFTEEDLVEPSRLAHRKRVRPRLDQGSGDDAPDDEAIEE